MEENEQISRFLAEKTFYCLMLHARIQPRLCKVNRRNDIGPCAVCSQVKVVGTQEPPPGRLPGWKRINKERKDATMAVRGTCKGCKRDDIQIAGAGLCWKCKKEAVDAGTYTTRRTRKQATPAVPPPAEDVPPAPKEETRKETPPQAAAGPTSAKTLTITAGTDVISAIVTCLVKLDRPYDLNIRS
jgi:hypothetical protein